MPELNRGAITVTTGSRLHFGLMRTGAPFGGVGVIIDEPQNVITIEPATDWQCDPEHADRIVPIVQRMVQHAGLNRLPNCRVQVEQALASHCGLGSGTQLSLAIAEGLCQFVGVHVPPLELATAIADRGKRSAVGVHGYFSGGLIYEAHAPHGQSHAKKLNLVAQRIELPEPWRIAFLLPPENDQSLSGEDEAECFSRLGNEDSTHTDRLTRTITDRLLPAAASSDFETFCDAVADYNQQSGMLFADVQGGAYNGREVTALIATLRKLGARGVGQSSWGPGVFAWFDSQESLDQFQDLANGQNLRIMSTARIKNTGRMLDDQR